jgi:heme exporter protein A
VRGGRTLFERLDFAVGPGGLLHLRGANGAGKTSLLRILCGLARPDEGEVRWGGQPLQRLDDAFRRELLYLGHHNALHEALDIGQNLAFAMALAGQAPDVRRMDQALVQLGLGRQLGRLVRHLSQGQKRRVALCRLLLAPARLWVLDEPLVALDQSGITWLGATLQTHLRGGGTVVLTSHQPLALDGVHEQVLELTP